MNREEKFGKIYELRFEIFFITQLAILFGSLIVPLAFYEMVLQPALFLFNLGTGLLFICHKKYLFRVFLGLFRLALLVFGWNFVGKPDQLGPLE